MIPTASLFAAVAPFAALVVVLIVLVFVDDRKRQADHLEWLRGQSKESCDGRPFGGGWSVAV